MKHLVLLLSAALAAPLAARGAEATKKTRVAVLDVRAVGTFDPKAVAGLSALITSEAANLPNVKVLGGSDISAIIGFDKQRSLLGCTDSQCLAEIGGAMGVEYLLVSEVSEVGGVWLLSMTVLDISRAQALKRVTKKAKVTADLVDLAPVAVEESLGFVVRGAAAPKQPAPAATAATPATSAATPATASASPAAGAAPAAVATKDPEPQGSGKGLAYALDGVGAAALIGGGVVAVLAKGAYADAQAIARDPAFPGDRKAAFEEKAKSTRNLNYLADGLFVAGAAALGAGLFLTFTGGEPQPPPAVTLAPVPHGGAVLFAGEF